APFLGRKRRRLRTRSIILDAATMVLSPLRLPHTISRSRISGSALSLPRLDAAVGPPAAPNVRSDALAGSAKHNQGRALIASQSEIKDVKVVPHVGAVCRSGERQHPELESETIYYLGNRLVVAIGNFGQAWLQENLPISGK